ncbi:MAG: LytTR family DNA-binding domain-containing protein [Bacteroidetes bacterium]|nr:LytTR family DNA-binding domain-containing protein [Bacteroidota bacterium]
MRVVIIEDESPAILKLENMLKEYDISIEVIARLSSVKESVDWITHHDGQADLYFMDVQLIDGLSFDIFNNVSIHKPIIFITAYNQYAINAFKVNSIDYLLKPLLYQDLSASLEKIKSLRNNLPSEEMLKYTELNNMLRDMQKKYKARFLTRVGDHIKSVKTENILLFYAEGRTVYIVTVKKDRYIIDYTLEELMKTLNPEMFFRPNRTFIVNFNAISDVLVYSNSRLRIKLTFEFEKEIIVSREKIGMLKSWLEG